MNKRGKLNIFLPFHFKFCNNFKFQNNNIKLQEQAQQ